MNKKILAKTLLPIATVALLGGGIASSLVACSKKQKVELVNYQLFNSKQDIYDYINKNAHHPAAPDLSYNTLDDYSFVVNSTSLVVGVTKVQKINFPYSFITIGNNYTVNFGTTDDLISLVFTGDSISLKHESTSLVFYQDGAWQEVNVVEDNKFTIHGESGNSPTISLANNYTTFYSFIGTPIEDDVKYIFDGWNEVKQYSESAWNYYLNSLNDTNLICSALYDFGIRSDWMEWDYLKFEELREEDGLTLYCYYFFYESKISTIYTFYKEKNGKYFQGSGGSSDFKTFTTEPYSAPYHKIVLDEESESYVLENCGNFGIELDPLEDPNLDNTGYFVEVNFDNGPNELFVF